jgi:hypothetical protein
MPNPPKLIGPHCRCGMLRVRFILILKKRSEETEQLKNLFGNHSLLVPQFFVGPCE